MSLTVVQTYERTRKSNRSNRAVLKRINPKWLPVRPSIRSSVSAKSVLAGKFQEYLKVYLVWISLTAP